jgi:ribonuclease-3
LQAVFARPLAEAGPPQKDPKTRLQEWLQGRQKPLPVYALLSESGEDHAKSFVVTCTLVQPPLTTQGEAGSRRAAEQIAAEVALERLKIDD